MERKILYLEIDEEITSVIDRLRKTGETEIHLVVPKEAALIQSIVNLKLLKKQADNLGKKIQIITHDKVGRNLAEQVGIHSVSRVGADADMLKQAEIPEKPEIQYKEKESIIEETKEVVFKKGKLDKEKEELMAGAESDVSAMSGKGEKKLPKKVRTGDLVPKFPYKKFFAIGFVVLILLSGLLYVYLPLTKIDLKVAAEKQSMKEDIVIDGNTKDTNNEKNIAQGHLITVEKEVTKTYPATGKKNVGSKAQGTVTVRNSYSTTAQTLVAGTRFESSGLVFKTQSDVTVPGLTMPAGIVIPGSADVSVIADSPGDNYNVGPSSFKLPSFSGTAKYDKFTGSSSGTMSGGTTKEVNVVSSDDITKAEGTFARDTKDEIGTEGKDKLGKDEVLDEKAEKVAVGDLIVSRSAGSEANDFNISSNVKFIGISYNKNDIANMVFEDFKSKVASSKQILEDKVNDMEVSISNVDFAKGTIEAEVAATVHLGTKIDEGRLKTEISADDEQKARDYLNGLDGVKEVNIDFWPGFMKHVSRLKSHIYIHTEFVETN